MGPEMIAAQAAMTIAQGAIESGDLTRRARALGDEATGIETQGAYDAVDALRTSRLQQGEDIAAAAASGAGLTHSVADILTGNAVERQREAMRLRAEASMAAYGRRLEAREARIGARGAVVNSVLRAGAQAISGAREMRREARLDAAEERDRDSRRPQPLGTIPIPPARGTGRGF